MSKPRRLASYLQPPRAQLSSDRLRRKLTVQVERNGNMRLDVALRKTSCFGNDASESSSLPPITKKPSLVERKISNTGGESLESPSEQQQTRLPDVSPEWQPLKRVSALQDSDQVAPRGAAVKTSASLTGKSSPDEKTDGRPKRQRKIARVAPITSQFSPRLSAFSEEGSHFTETLPMIMSPETEKTCTENKNRHSIKTRADGNRSSKNDVTPNCDAALMKIYSRDRLMTSRDYAMQCLQVASQFTERAWLHQLRQAEVIAARGVRNTLDGKPHLFSAQA